ncbi:MFS transporter [Kocuria sp.]|uniref:MFS transporter n=1 Tax=Kocuria sp. TaxID=1871328 RepID=UPI0026E03872|nr:MFS transporter [Kocuria sp.]MDO5618308.1 MFS transporter [Kocuria sp.]
MSPAKRAARNQAPKQPIPQEVKVLIAAAFAIALGFGIVVPVLPQYAASFNVGVAAASAVISAFAFCRLIFAPAGGRILDKIGERRTYITGLLIVALSSFATAFAGDYWQLLIYRGLGGIGSTMFTVSAMGLIVRLSPVSERGRISGLYGSTFLIGGILGPVIGGLLAGIGLRAPFLIYGVAILIAAAVVYFRIAPDALGDRKSRTAQPRMSFQEAWAFGPYRAALVSGFANGWTSYGIRVALVPLLVAAAFGAGPVLSGVALTIYAAGSAVALTFTGRLADQLGRKPLVITGLLVAGAMTIVVGVTENVYVFAVASFLAGVGSGTLSPGQQAAVADVVGPHRSGGQVLARFQMSMDAGQIVGPIAAGAIVDAAGFGWAFGLSGLMLLLASLAWIPVTDTTKRHDVDAVPTGSIPQVPLREDSEGDAAGPQSPKS